jgi:hypothetical protein
MAVVTYTKGWIVTLPNGKRSFELGQMTDAGVRTKLQMLFPKARVARTRIKESMKRNHAEVPGKE